MQLSYTHSWYSALQVAVWHPGRPSYESQREDQQTRRPLSWTCPPNIQSTPMPLRLSGMETRTSKHFYNLHINSHWDRNSIKISPWNLDTDPLEDYWESQWVNQIDNSSQLTECLLIKSCSSASQSTINCGFWEKPTAWFLDPATRLGFSAPSGRSASDGDSRHTVPSKDTLKGTVHTRYPPKKNSLVARSYIFTVPRRS